MSVSRRSTRTGSVAGTDQSNMSLLHTILRFGNSENIFREINRRKYFKVDITMGKKGNVDPPNIKNIIQSCLFGGTVPRGRSFSRSKSGSYLSSSSSSSELPLPFSCFTLSIFTSLLLLFSHLMPTKKVFFFGWFYTIGSRRHNRHAVSF